MTSSHGRNKVALNRGLVCAMPVDDAPNDPEIPHESLWELKNVTIGTRQALDGRLQIGLIARDDTGAPYAVHALSLEEAFAFGSRLCALSKKLGGG